MRLLLVSCLILFSPAVALPWGIQYNTVTVDDLLAGGCSPCLSEYYATPTTSANILSCAGPVLFVGAKYGWSSTLNLGAYGLASEVQTVTALNTPHLSNGVYWYFVPGQSFGFLKDNTLQQASADIGTTNPDSRLSWHLDVNGGGVSVGGYRAGSYNQLNHDTNWQKIIYNCPNGTLQRTVST